MSLSSSKRKVVGNIIANTDNDVEELVNAGNTNFGTTRNLN